MQKEEKFTYTRGGAKDDPGFLAVGPQMTLLLSDPMLPSLS